MADLGPAFDTNVLNMPTPRRLMSLWMECAELPVPILPTVMAELTRGPRLHASPMDGDLDQLIESARQLAISSNALVCERRRMQRVVQERPRGAV